MTIAEIALRLTEATLKDRFLPPAVQFIDRGKGEEFQRSVDCFKAILSALDRDQDLIQMIERNSR